jgi:hypothetical protein
MIGNMFTVALRLVIGGSIAKAIPWQVLNNKTESTVDTANTSPSELLCIVQPLKMSF